MVPAYRNVLNNISIVGTIVQRRRMVLYKCALLGINGVLLLTTELAQWL